MRGGGPCEWRHLALAHDIILIARDARRRIWVDGEAIASTISVDSNLFWFILPTSMSPGWRMVTIGAFDAKTHLSALLERVAAGEEVVITKHGKAVARLVPASNVDRARAINAFAKLKELRKGTWLGDLSWKELRDAGRP